MDHRNLWRNFYGLREKPQGGRVVALASAETCDLSQRVPKKYLVLGRRSVLIPAKREGAGGIVVLLEIRSRLLLLCGCGGNPVGKERNKKERSRRHRREGPLFHKLGSEETGGRHVQNRIKGGTCVTQVPLRGQGANLELYPKPVLDLAWTSVAAGDSEGTLRAPR
jgi:hypothetical protein